MNRLHANTPKGFSGSAIDRSRPLRFRLDGRLISGFSGDTVLSAALASGVDTLGSHQNSVIGLTPSAAPVIAPVSAATDPLAALPMAGTPALDGADLVTIGGKRLNLWARLFLPGRSLGLPLDEPHCLDQPWRGLPGNPGPDSDLVVIGGGVAGMSAALAGARAGLSVTVVEASPVLGGHSGLFGTQEGEDAPEASIARLRDAVAANARIAVFTSAQAYAIRPGLVRVHRVIVADNKARGEVTDLSARFIVIASGSRERLPVFSGNRLPGVIGALDAYELAARYGVWPGKSALFATGSNAAYRLAMLASDAGIAVSRVLDSRPGPASRFIEFSRAYGMVQVTGTPVAAAETARGGGALSVIPHRDDATPFIADRLVVSGGWQPDLTLWHIAGGASRWHEGRHRIEPLGTLEGIALAGSAAGYLTRRGCIQSGAVAVDTLLGRDHAPVEDPVIDALYETPDAATSVAPEKGGNAPTYLDNGPEFLQRPLPPRRGITSLFRRRHSGLTALSEAPQPLAINDVAAGVNLGLIPPAAAGVVAQERVALVALNAPAASEPTPEEAPPIPAEVPAFLMGRYGHDAHVVRVVPAEERRLEAGALIYDSPDISDPIRSIGVVLRIHGAAATALLNGNAAKSGHRVTVRDQGRAVSAVVELGGLAPL